MSPSASPDLRVEGLPTVALTTLGCRVNQAETEAIARDFARRGFRIVPFGDEADVCVLNTCTITHQADREARQMVRRAARGNPDGLLVVTGCYATVASEEVAALPGVDAVVTNAGKDGLAQQVTAMLRERGRLRHEVDADVARVPGWFGRTRAQLKVEDGCNNRCTFCIVPAARGAQRSVPVGRVVSTVIDLERAGYREVVLTGTHLGGYGRDLQPRRALRHLVQTLLDESHIDRIRLSSVEPQDFPLDSLHLWQDRRLCRHFHLPVQSGNDDVLRAMRRGYRSARFETLAHSISALAPDAAITTDVIVGFPGETDEQFYDTVALLERCGVARVHVFPYSPRADTPAAMMPDQVPAARKKERVRHLTHMSERWHRTFCERIVGTEVPVLFEQETSPGVWEGLTSNYVRVRCRHASSLFNLLVSVRVEAVDGDGVMGRLGDVGGRRLLTVTALRAT